MLIVIKYAHRDHDGKERIRRIVTESPSVSHWYNSAMDNMKTGERVVQISEGGYS
jgi:hypothetical protein